MMSRRKQIFGGDWTEQKLGMLREYLQAYRTALKRQPFELLYIDAFAGTGYREVRAAESAENLLFPELREEEAEGFLNGSARIALQVTPPFDEYVFIEKTASRFEELRKLRREYPRLAKRIKLVQEDCNVRLRRICEGTDWRGRRAVLFLDPFAMQVEWDTLEAVAATRAMDTWILWPVMAMNRLLHHAGEIPASWRLRLDRFLGTTQWYCQFYRVRKGRDLFGEDIEEINKVADFRVIRDFLNQRLATIFADVADNPRLLLNSRGTPLFLFCFAAANPKGAPIAKRIAEHILKE